MEILSYVYMYLHFKAHIDMPPTNHWIIYAILANKKRIPALTVAEKVLGKLHFITDLNLLFSKKRPPRNWMTLSAEFIIYGLPFS